jgi:hypothetical protein
VIGADVAVGVVNGRIVLVEGIGVTVRESILISIDLTEETAVA